MTTMLRHKVTGEIWCYNRDLARHEDVEPFESVDPQFAAAAAIPEPAPEPVVDHEPAPEPVVSKRKKKEEGPVVEFSTEDELADLDDLLGDA